MAKVAGRSTQEYVQLFVLEGFLSRLAVSAYRETFVLKGGVLLAALGSRRPTRDIDFAATDIDNDVDNLRRVICDIAGTNPPTTTAWSTTPRLPRPTPSATRTSTPASASTCR